MCSGSPCSQTVTLSASEAERIALATSTSGHLLGVVLFVIKDAVDDVVNVECYGFAGAQEGEDRPVLQRAGCCPRRGT
jgi:hypothetical protein